MNGEAAWICLLCCNADSEWSPSPHDAIPPAKSLTPLRPPSSFCASPVLFSAVVLQWLTTADHAATQTPSSAPACSYRHHSSYHHAAAAATHARTTTAAAEGHAAMDAGFDDDDDDETIVATRAAAPASGCWACRGRSSDAAPDDDVEGHRGPMPRGGVPEKGNPGS